MGGIGRRERERGGRQKRISNSSFARSRRIPPAASGDLCYHSLEWTFVLFAENTRYTRAYGDLGAGRFIRPWLILLALFLGSEVYRFADFISYAEHSIFNYSGSHTIAQNRRSRLFTTSISFLFPSARRVSSFPFVARQSK